jgi:cell wall-associated NlpC family hydrolase
MQLQAQLRQTSSQLNRADADLSEGQKQLMKFGNTLRQAMMEAGPDAKGLHPFVKVSQRYAGTPYVWGGESARGFDCSGLSFA